MPGRSSADLLCLARCCAALRCFSTLRCTLQLSCTGSCCCRCALPTDPQDNCLRALHQAPSRYKQPQTAPRTLTEAACAQQDTQRDCILCCGLGELWCCVTGHQVPPLAVPVLCCCANCNLLNGTNSTPMQPEYSMTTVDWQDVVRLLCRCMQDIHVHCRLVNVNLLPRCVRIRLDTIAGCCACRQASKAPLLKSQHNTQASKQAIHKQHTCHLQVHRAPKEPHRYAWSMRRQLHTPAARSFARTRPCRGPAPC